MFNQARWQYYGNFYFMLQKLKNSPSTVKARGIVHRGGDIQCLRRSQKSNVNPLKLYIVVRLATLLVNNSQNNKVRTKQSRTQVHSGTFTTPHHRLILRFAASCEIWYSWPQYSGPVTRVEGGTALISAAQGEWASMSLYHLQRCSLLCHLVWTDCVTSCLNRYVACSR